MRKLRDYTDREITDILHGEAWASPLKPVTRVKPSGWLAAAFWGLRVYVVLMLGVVVFAFVRGIH